MLFVDYSSAFNTIIPDILTEKLTTIGLPPLTCAWIKRLSFQLTPDCETQPPLVLHPHAVHWLSTGLSPLLYCLSTSDFSPTHNNNFIVKFADDTRVVRLISKGGRLQRGPEADSLVFREQPRSEHQKEQADHRRLQETQQRPSPPLQQRRESGKGPHLSWRPHLRIFWSENVTAINKKAKQRLHFLRVLRRYNLDSAADLLLLIHREPADVLYYSIVRQLHHCGQGKAAGGEGGEKQRRGSSAALSPPCRTFTPPAASAEPLT